VQIAVLASGTGSILSALIEADLPIAVVLVDRPCAAEQIAERAGIPLERVVRTDFGADFDRAAYTALVAEALDPYSVELLAMAGYGTVLGAAIHDAYPGQILNTHPALLPAFKGWHAVEAALDAGVAETGCTVHYATLEVDDGPILAAERVPIVPGDTVETLHERIKAVERRLYPETIKALLHQRESDTSRGAR
jgi:phosphoribosylglycinamide formyltransferase-1